MRVIKNLQSCFKSEEAFEYAEFGIYKGDTALKILQLFPNSIIHLFDFEHTINEVQHKFIGFLDRVNFYSNSSAYLDSYNWSLIPLLRKNDFPRWDYIFIDGAHVWSVDALTFFLSDSLLRVGGYFEFDDVDWTIRNSSLNPKRVRLMKKFFTKEQIDSRQVELIIDLLVRPSQRFKEVVPERLFRKIAK